MAKEASSSFAFITDYLRNNKKAPFAEVRDAAAKKGHTIYPISYGKAQAMLGIVKMSKRGQGKAARAKAAAARKGVPTWVDDNGTPKRGPGRPRKNAAAAPSGNGRRRVARAGARSGAAAGGAENALDSIAAEIRALTQERDQLRRTLEKMRELVDAAV